MYYYYHQTELNSFSGVNDKKTEYSILIVDFFLIRINK